MKISWHPHAYIITSESNDYYFKKDDQLNGTVQTARPDNG